MSLSGYRKSGKMVITPFLAEAKSRSYAARRVLFWDVSSRAILGVHDLYVQNHRCEFLYLRDGRNRYWSSQSYRTVRLYRSMYVFCCGLPGWICFNRICFLSAQAVSAALIYSGTLSQRKARGCHRHSISCSRARMTRSARK